MNTKNSFKHIFKNQIIEDEVLEYILDWTKGYTFYTQYICNKLYVKKFKKINIGSVKDVILETLTERDGVYYNYRKLLSHHQYKLLRAIAKENRVKEPTSQAFIKKYDLGNASTVRKNLKALLDKELVYDFSEEDKLRYEIYDVFLSRWLERN
ncbi:MAG: hypothetical protein ABEH43_10215 [Flavobacteriales bacterium]